MSGLFAGGFHLQVTATAAAFAKLSNKCQEPALVFQ